MKHLMINEALPIAELSRLGLYDGNKHLLSDADLSALLSGRRTSMVNLRDLVSEAFVIDSLDAKLSLHTDEDNFQEIKLHPIYKEPQLMPDLSEEESRLMISGEQPNMAKTIRFSDGTDRTIVFEYDGETKEFISYDASKLSVPIKINGETLNAEKQKEFALGSIVELTEGTIIQYRASQPKGIIANRAALIVSYLGEDAGFLIENISSIKDADIQLSPFTIGFENAFAGMQKNGSIDVNAGFLQKDLAELKSEYSRGYSHGISR
ncbi:DUF4099 domain-containing protein [Pedobacter sp. P26]|uniref:DUF4099 domain-containing protein n=1 Tax=Pedobacter sp. P26 TaxID=3423956 RepID=UPI003D66DE62